MADKIRRELSAPIAPARRDRLHQDIIEAKRSVDGYLREQGTNLRALAAPSRRAYQYLTSIDLNAIPTSNDTVTDARAPASVRLIGLRSFLDHACDALAVPPDVEEFDAIRESITTTHRKIEHQLLTGGIEPHHLKPESARIRGWLAYFCLDGKLEAYLDCVRQAKPIMDLAANRSARRVSSPVHVHFRPTTSLYRWQRRADAIRLCLPTPMMSFDREGFDALGDMVFGNGKSRQAVIRRTESLAYRAVASELADLCNDSEHDGGVFFDLKDSFDRVNAAYFEGELSPPRLVWSRQVTGRKFGHYDFAADTVMLSMTLDAHDVPSYVVDFIVYHELLHKALGLRWRNGRAFAHTPEFRRRERLFHLFRDAEAVLTRLAKRFR